MIEAQVVGENSTSVSGSLVQIVLGLLSGCVYAYGLTLTVYLVVRFLTSIPLWWFDILGGLMPTLLIPSLGLLPLALLFRRRRMALVLILPLITFVVVYGADFAPYSAVDGSPDLTVMTFNKLGGNHNVDAITTVIRDSDPDVVLLQEVSRFTAIRLPPALANDYAYNSQHWDDISRLGLGVFSRYPLLADTFTTYQSQSSWLRLQIEVKGQLLTIYTVHLANPFTQDTLYDAEPRTDGVDQLLAVLADEHAPLIVAGDFNMTEVSADYRRMTEHLIDSFPESGSGLGLTFPADIFMPLARIDYVFHSPDIHSLNAQVMSSNGGSDHYPVRVELSLSP